VVHVYSPGTCEVEFVTARGRTAALVTLDSSQLRRATDDDLICVSRIQPLTDAGRRPHRRHD
jgi:Domain of unknown function (DUF4926)